MGMRIARLGLAGTVLLSAGMTVAACAPSPGFDVAVAVGWAHAQADREPVATNEIGRAVVTTGADTVALPVAEPSAVTSVRARCAGDQTVWIEATVRGLKGGVDASARADGRVACDLRDHVIAVPAASGILASSVTLRAASAATTAVLVAVEGAVRSDDPWQGYFDAAMTDDDSRHSAMVTAGTFGPPGGIQVFSSTDLSLPAAVHMIEFTCVGAQQVTVTAAPVTREDGEATATAGAIWTDVSCPGNTALELVTDTDGLSLTADSHGEPGAFLFRVDPGSVFDAP